MSIQSFEELLLAVKKLPTKRLAVAVAQDRDVLHAVDAAYRKGIAEATLVGNENEILHIAETECLDLSPFKIINKADKTEACRYAVDLVARGEADLPMKGFVDTSVFLRAVLNKEDGLSDGKLISHVGLFAVPGFERLIIITDSAMNIAPEINEKADIIRNAVAVAHALGNTCPKVAVLCAVEKVNP